MSADASPLPPQVRERAAVAQRLVGEVLREGCWPGRSGAADFLFTQLYHMLASGLIQAGPGMPNGPVF